MNVINTKFLFTLIRIFCVALVVEESCLLVADVAAAVVVLSEPAPVLVSPLVELSSVGIVAADWWREQSFVSLSSVIEYSASLVE